MDQQNYQENKPSSMFAMASWAVLAIGVLGYLVGLWNVELMSIGE